MLAMAFQGKWKKLAVPPLLVRFQTLTEMSKNMTVLKNVAP